MLRKIIHIDMDCFYAAIEMRDNPDLRGKPIAVGGSREQRGVLATCNYEARKSGLHSAMPTALAFKKCPDLISLPVNMAKYRQVSAEIQAIFKRYTDIIEPLSLDEAYLDVSDCKAHQGSATWIAAAIRDQIFAETQLTASAGIASNKLLAKIASDWNKPNGQFVIQPEQVNDFMQTLPVNKIFGVGKVMTQKMQGHGIQTCEDLQAFSREQLHDLFGKFGSALFDLCRGIDDRPVEANRLRKSVSTEETFNYDLQTMSECEQALIRVYEDFCRRIKKHQDRFIHKQFVKIKFSDFSRTTAECISHSYNFEQFKQLFSEAKSRSDLSIRLIGLGVKFQEQQLQRTFF